MMKKSIQTASRFLAASLACLAVLMAEAREPTSFPTRRVDDSTGIVWQYSPIPKNPVPSTSGATLLPYTMPPGTYLNSAVYPLLLTVSPPGPSCYDFSVYVNGQFIAQARDDCERSNTSVTVLVPAGSSFSITGGNTRVTALANGATWEQTGVVFRVAIGSTEQYYYDGTGCWQMTYVTTTYSTNVGGQPTTETVMTAQDFVCNAGG